MVAVGQTNLEALFDLPCRNGIHCLVDDVIHTKLLASNARMRLVNCINDHRAYLSLPLYNMHVLAEQIDRYPGRDSLQSYVGTLLEAEPG